MRIARTTAVSGAFAAVALVGAGTASAAAAGSTAHHRPAVRVQVVGKQSVQAPRHTHPGLVRVRNVGKRPVLILDPLESAGVATLVQEMNAANSDSGKLDFTRDFAVVDLLLPHTGAYVQLKPGVHYLLDAEANQYTAADVTALHVKGTKRNAVAPSATMLDVKHNGTLTSVPQKQLDKNASVHVLNKSTRLEEVFVAPVNKDVSDSELKKFIGHPSFQGLYQIASFRLTLLGLTSPHHSYSAELHSKAGRHLLVAIALTGDEGMVKIRPGQVRLLHLG